MITSHIILPYAVKANGVVVPGLGGLSYLFMKI